MFLLEGALSEGRPLRRERRHLDWGAHRETARPRHACRRAASRVWKGLFDHSCARDVRDAPEPGSAIFRCFSASASDVVMWAAATCSLFFQPVTTSPSPPIIASKPALATSPGSSLSD